MGPTSLVRSRSWSSVAFQVFPWVVVVVFAAAGFTSVLPPSTLPDDAPAATFSATRAATHIEAIATEPHPMGSLAIKAVRSYLVSEIEALGLQPEFQAVSAPDFYNPGRPPVEVVNVIARIPGSASTGAIVLMAHYDTVPATAGANDNSAGVATLLEAGRALLAAAPPRNDVILLFTDGEEPFPQYGSTAFVDDNPDFDDVAVAINLEANGGAGPSTLVEISGSEGWLVRQYASAVSNPTAFSFIAEVTALIGEIGTDFDAFRNAGVPGFHFAYMRGSPIYHSPADNVQSVDWDSVQHHGSNALGVVKHFGNLNLAAVPGTDESVYFTVRPFFVQYEAAGSLASAVAAAVLLLLGILRLRRDGLEAFGSNVRSTGFGLLLVVVATATATLAWLAITAIRPTPTATESYAYLVGVVGLVAFVGLWLNGRSTDTRRMRGPGFLVLWVGLALFTALAAPGFSALFALPALAGSAALNWNAGARRWVRAPRFTLVAAPTVLLLVPAIDFFFQFGQPRPGNPDSSIPSVAAVAFLLAFLGAGLLWSTWIQSEESVEPACRGGHAILHS